MSGAYLLQNATEQVPNHVILNGFHSEDSDQAIQQRLPVQQQNVKSSRVYVFGADDVDEQEINTDRIEMTEVRARGKARNHNLPKTVVDDVPQFINYQIKDGDTLQNIALKFACPLSEIKRHNNLIRDQEFYALSIIKIPIVRHGLLSEIRDELEAGPSRSYRAHSDSASEAIANESYEDTDSESQNLLVHTRTVSIRDALSSQGKDAAKFLQRMDKDIHKIIESTKSRMDTLEEVTKSLTCRRIYPLQQRRSLFSGVDCGIRWWSLLIIVGVVAVIMPTLYVVYSKLVKPPS